MTKLLPIALALLVMGGVANAELDEMFTIYKEDKFKIIIKCDYLEEYCEFVEEVTLIWPNIDEGVLTVTPRFHIQRGTKMYFGGEYAKREAVTD